MACDPNGLPVGDYYNEALKGWWQGEVYNYVYGAGEEYHWNKFDEVESDIEVSGPDPGKK